VLGLLVEAALLLVGVVLLRGRRAGRSQPSEPAAETP